MAEEGFRAKVRVVRCPKCEKLLPELANFSVYRCGGCGATLQARKSVPGSVVSLEKSEAEGIKTIEVFELDTEKHGMVSDSNLETDDKGNIAESRSKKSLPQGAASSHDVSVTGNGGSGTRKEHIVSKSDGLPKENGVDSMESSKSRCQCKTPSSEHSRHVTEHPERDRTPRSPPMASVHPDLHPTEGPSDHLRNPRHPFANADGESKQNLDGASRVGHLEQDRAKLLRMLDELRDQVRRSCETTDRQKTTAPVDNVTTSSNSYVHHDNANWFPESSSSSNLNPSRYFPVRHDHHTSMFNFYPSMPAQSDMPIYGDPFGHRRAPLHLPGECTQRQMDSFLFGHFDPAPVMPYRHDGFYHQPACSCPQCYQRPFVLPARAPPTILGYQRVPYPTTNHELYAVDGTRSYNSRVGNAALHRFEPRSQYDSRLSKNAARSCQPVVGAAPFTVCPSCFELLQLPEKSLLLKNKFDLRCGSCFKLISIQYEGSRLVLSAITTVSHVSSENHNSSCDSPVGGIRSIGEKLVLPYIFTSNDHEMIEGGHDLHSSESEKMHGLSLSSTTSGYVESPESAISQKDVPISPGISLETQVISRVPSLPLREHFGYSLSDQAVDGSGNGSRSTRSDQVRNISLNGNFKQNSAKDVQMAIQMDLSDDEDPPAGLSQDSWHMISKDDFQPRFMKPNDSFLAGFIKKSLRPFHQSLGHGGFKVSINGQSVSDRSVKKAEKQAGPIFPGDYWYDNRAGFWGAMGQPCLGIIPPFIEEFNYPMPKNCAGGDTGVLVNGRELHQKDLDLLVGRGLPPTRGSSYIIEISGKVWDESSGEELDGLGKLAPTVEKVKHGFGMCLPYVFA
ncbi:unnamed protein product [Musa acuminata subsp. burmannicoides]